MLTVLLSKVLGLFLFLIGIAVALRRDYFIPVVATFVEARLMRFVLAVLELLGGLFLVVGYNDFSSGPAAIITLLGWLAVVESLAYMLLPDRVLQQLIAAINNPSWYLGGGVVSIVLGLYLAAHGFGLI